MSTGGGCLAWQRKHDYSDAKFAGPDLKWKSSWKENDAQLSKIDKKYD